jgi:RNA polymerase sigma-70 factor (ECF subfamily)
MYRILMHAAQDEISRRRRFQVVVQSAASQPTSVADRSREIADRDQLEQGFRHLSVDHRAVVVLHHYVGLPMPEVADALGIPTGTAKSRYHHAMAALRAALDAQARLDETAEVSA